MNKQLVVYHVYRDEITATIDSACVQVYVNACLHCFNSHTQSVNTERLMRGKTGMRQSGIAASEQHCWTDKVATQMLQEGFCTGKHFNGLPAGAHAVGPSPMYSYFDEPVYDSTSKHAKKYPLGSHDDDDAAYRIPETNHHHQ